MVPPRHAHAICCPGVQASPPLLLPLLVDAAPPVPPASAPPLPLLVLLLVDAAPPVPPASAPPLPVVPESGPPASAPPLPLPASAPPLPLLPASTPASLPASPDPASRSHPGIAVHALGLVPGAQSWQGSAGFDAVAG